VYFPEYRLSLQLGTPVYAFAEDGQRKLNEAYAQLARHLHVDAVVLADGGCDSILSGRERGLATPVEDFMSMRAAAQLDLPVFLMILGATADTFADAGGSMRIARADFLRRLETLRADGTLLDATVLDPSSPEVCAYRRVFEACDPARSIVNAAICARLNGLRGAVAPPLLRGRCAAENFVLDDFLTTAFTFDLRAVLAQVAYKDLIPDDADSSDAIDEHIMAFNASLWPDLGTG
jgi:hypothetical protein